MGTSDPKPWHHPEPKSLMFRASSGRIAISLIPIAAFFAVGCIVQYALEGALTPGMESVLVGSGLFSLLMILVLPFLNCIEFSPECFSIRQLSGRKQIPWREIEPGSIGALVRTFCGIPILTNIGFRLMPDSPHRTALRESACLTTGMHFYFVNLYPLYRDELLALLRKYQMEYGN